MIDQEMKVLIMCQGISAGAGEVNIRPNTDEEVGCPGNRRKKIGITRREPDRPGYVGRILVDLVCRGCEKNRAGWTGTVVAKG